MRGLEDGLELADERVGGLGDRFFERVYRCPCTSLAHGDVQIELLFHVVIERRSVIPAAVASSLFVTAAVSAVANSSIDSRGS